MSRQMMKFASGAEIHPPSVHVVDCSGDEDKTIQSAKDDCDINVLVKRFANTGQVPPVDAAPFFGDFSQVEDFHHAMNMVVNAREKFMMLSPEARLKFNNEPGQLIEYLNSDFDERKLKEARALGLCVPEAVAAEPQLVRVVADPSAAAPAAPGAPSSP